MGGVINKMKIKYSMLGTRYGKMPCIFFSALQAIVVDEMYHIL